MIRLIDTAALVVRVFKFFLATGELCQFRYLNDAEANDDDAVVTHEEAEAEVD